MSTQLLYTSAQDAIIFGALTLFLGACIFIACFGFQQVYLVWRAQAKRWHTYRRLEDQELPSVCLQLPVYNEYYVLPRLLDAVSHIDYPKQKLQVQLLDDSTDDSWRLAERIVQDLQAQGFPITHIRRSRRVGYKAGALAYGLSQTDAEFIAILDADFIPQKDFIRRLVAGFSHCQIGVVQGRWGHLNRQENLLTHSQAFHLDAHFTVEQEGRSHGGYFLNFNGTAGMWRRACIEDAGGWSADTLTEDLDLSYRAQIKGWSIRYLDDLEVPSELPAQFPALRSQQHRWMKGGAEVARKMLGTLWRSNASLVQKSLGTLHLVGSSVFVAVFYVVLISTALDIAEALQPLPDWVINFKTLSGALLLFSLGCLSIAYIFSFRIREHTMPQALARFFVHLVPFLMTCVGMSFHNTIAVFEGWLGISSPFVRTPKFADRHQETNTKLTTTLRYKSRTIPYAIWIELCIGLTLLAGAAFTLLHDKWLSSIFLCIHALGFLYISLGTIRDIYMSWRPNNASTANPNNAVVQSA